MPAKKKKARRLARKRPATRPPRQQPESLRLRSMAASFTVNDLDRSVAWYRDVLGFVVGERWEDEPQHIAKGRDRRKGDGFRLWVATVQDIISVAARVKAKGWTLDREPSETPWGDWAFALTDPDGFKITVIQE